MICQEVYTGLRELNCGVHTPTVCNVLGLGATASTQETEWPVRFADNCSLYIGDLLRNTVVSELLELKELSSVPRGAYNDGDQSECEAQNVASVSAETLPEL